MRPTVRGLVLAAFLAPLAAAEIESVEIARREVVLGGRAFGQAGAYEKLAGTATLALDPANPYDAVVCDLDLAPRGADGRVRAVADLMVLQPVDPERRAGTAFVEVSNRGGKAALGYFQRASYAYDPTAEEHFGDGLLMRRGLTIVWIGWQFDVPREEGRLRLRAPVATHGGGTITGLVRCDWVVDRPAVLLRLGHRDHVPYAIADRNAPENVLTWREGRYSQRHAVPRESWRFDPAGEAILAARGSFESGRIWELVYLARDPAVVGMGLCAIRDVAAYAKHDESCPFPAERAVAFGVSQTGRFLRHFLWQGFNTDEMGRPAYDGLLIHTAGAGRGSFNHRFAQPSRDAHRYSAFFYPTDLFPFAFGAQRDPVTGARDGVLARLEARGHVPKILVTNTGYEYWGRAASLVHTSLDGSADVELHPRVRLYHLAGAQHFAGPWPPRDDLRLQAGVPAWRGNPRDLLLTLRALLVDLVEWVEDDTPPPPSTYPRVAEGTLVALDELRWPPIPGLPAPGVMHLAHRMDYGPEWSRGIITVEPPRVGAAYGGLVPQVDELGNETGGLRGVETLVPLATYAPWCLRPDGELFDFWGTYAPLAATSALAAERGDPRPALERLYASREEFLARAEATARGLVEDRTLLAEDVPVVLERAAAEWDHAVE